MLYRSVTPGRRANRISLVFCNEICGTELPILQIFRIFLYSSSAEVKNGDWDREDGSRVLRVEMLS